MPPSGPLLSLYPVGHGSPVGSPIAAANSPVRIRRTDIAKPEAIDPENTHPNSSRANSQSLVLTSQAASFLEMEEDETCVERYDDSLFHDITLNEKDTNENNVRLLLPMADAASSEEEKKEEEYPTLTARFPSSALPTLSRVNGVSCGKRPRNSRRVSFAPAAQWSTASNSLQRCGNNDLFLRVRETIHLTDYSNEERAATWYTIDDLKSFKKDRKDTARHVDNGLLSLRQNAHQTALSDIFVDTTSFSEPVEFCSRGVENCTEAVCRIRYRHICDGWRMVLNTQEKHNYLKQKLSFLSNSEKREYNALASMLGVGRSKASRRTINNGWFRYGSNGNPSPKSSPKSSQTNPFEGMCCPYDLAAAYIPTSEASLDIARNRAIGDERDVLALQEQDRLEYEAQDAVERQNTSSSDIGNDTTLAKIVVSKEEKNQNDNSCSADKNTERVLNTTLFVGGALRIVDV